MMENKINTGGPAFPVPGLSNLPNDQFIWPETGMALRDYFAAKAMQGICAHLETWGLRDTEIAKKAYVLADAMIKAREVTQ